MKGTVVVTAEPLGLPPGEFENFGHKVGTLGAQSSPFWMLGA